MTELSEGPAGLVCQAMGLEYKRFQGLISEHEELAVTIFLPTREIRFRDATVKPLPSGLINFFGETHEGKLIDVAMHYTLLSYMVEVTRPATPSPMGFTVNISGE
jgi:hypothetical protein